MAQTVLSKGANGGQVTINIAWGLGVVMGCYVSAGVSGAHLNPAVSIALAVHRGFPWRKVVPYSLAQTLGAFVAAAIVFVTYHEAFAAFDGGVRQVLTAGTAGIFATYPQALPASTFPGGVVDGGRDGHPGGRNIRHQRCPARRAVGPGAGGGRAAGRGHRDVVRVQRRVRDQPGA